MELRFETRAEFRTWLAGHGATSRGVWLVFGKRPDVRTLTAQDALEEALCFGWIDGRIQRIDSSRYSKYFAPRRPGSQWSEKNRTLAVLLEEQGRMTEAGRAQIEAAKKVGTWETPKREPIAPKQVQALVERVRELEPAHANLLKMPPSVQRTYAGYYGEAKSDAVRERRLAWIVDRLNRNLRPMEGYAPRRADDQPE